MKEIIISTIFIAIIVVIICIIVSKYENYTTAITTTSIPPSGKSVSRQIGESDALLYGYEDYGNQNMFTGDVGDIRGAPENLILSLYKVK